MNTSTPVYLNYSLSSTLYLQENPAFEGRERDGRVVSFTTRPYSRIYGSLNLVQMELGLYFRQQLSPWI